MRRVTTILCPLLVGRDEILELAEPANRGVAAGDGRVLLISGEAGICKSRLSISPKTASAHAGSRRYRAPANLTGSA